MLGELNVRGQVKFRKGNIAYIKADNQKVTYSFNKGVTIDVPFDEFQEYDYVDFYGTNYDGRLRANYVRKSGLEWQKGVIVELNDDKDAYCRIKSEGGRIFGLKKDVFVREREKKNLQLVTLLNSSVKAIMEEAEIKL